MKYLLDTHAAFWLAIGSTKLSKAAQRKLSRSPSGALAIADITLFELAMLEQKQRIAFASDFLSALAARFEVLPIEPAIAAAAATLALPQGDPFDRLIVATALHHELVLVTKDDAITDSRIVPTLW